MAHFVIKTVTVRESERVKREKIQRPNRISELNDKFKFVVVVVAATAAVGRGADTFRFRSEILEFTFNRFLCIFSSKQTVLDNENRERVG